MSRSVNSTTLLGYVGADPTLRYMPSGRAVANCRLATSSSWKDKQSGETREATEWHSLVFFDRLAEIVAERVTKGTQIYVQGPSRTRQWEDREKITRYTTEVIGKEMILLAAAGNGSPRSAAAAEPNETSDTPPPMDFDDIPTE